MKQTVFLLVALLLAGCAAHLPPGDPTSEPPCIPAGYESLSEMPAFAFLNPQTKAIEYGTRYLAEYRRGRQVMVVVRDSDSAIAVVDSATANADTPTFVQGSCVQGD